jgi:hypothetical protein
VAVLRDAVAPLDPDLGDAAIAMMRRNMSARLVASTEWLSER